MMGGAWPTMTCVSLEDVFWNEFPAIANERNVHLSKLIDEIVSERSRSNLSAAIRLFVLERYYRRK